MKKEMIIVFLTVLFLVAFPLITSNEGSISLTILPNNLTIFVHSPENISYNFSRTDIFNISLNVSSIPEAESWWFSLEELLRQRAGGVILGGNIIYSNVSFMPNITFVAKRFSNKISVYANDSFGNNDNEGVVFFVHVNNSAPTLNLSGEIFACEGSSIQPGFL